MSDRRKKIIYLLLGVIAAAWAGDWLLANAIDGPLEERQEKAASLEKKIKKKKRELNAARKEIEKLEVWENQSLPANIERASSLYRAWLFGIVERAGLTQTNVDSGAAVKRQNSYHSLSFSVKGRGTLEQMKDFLYEFYSADQLHQTRSLTDTPLKSLGALDMSVTIEALVLPGAKRESSLNTGKSDRLAFADRASYRTIVERNLFGVGGGFDEAEHTYLSAVTYAGQKREAWFSLRAKDQTIKLVEGKELSVGNFRATVVEIEDSDVVLETDGERWLLSIGENLDQASALPPGF